MTKKTPETLAAILDTLASGTVVYSDAAKSCGVQPNTFWTWMRSSALNRDPALWIDYLNERLPFHVAVEAARQIALSDARARIEKRTLIYQGGATPFKDIPEYEPVLAPGEPEPEEAPRVDAEPGASSDAPFLSANLTGDDDLDDLLGPEPVAAGDTRVSETEPVAERVPDEVEPVAPVPDEAETERVPDAPAAPVAIDAAPTRQPRNDLERDLIARLAAARAKNASRTAERTGQPEGPSADSLMALRPR